MSISNKLNLPAPILAAIMNDPHTPSGADISVSQLLKPPRIVQLERLHRDEIVEDASERIWSLLGRLGHKVLEQAGDASHVEQALIATFAGWTVSARIDLLGDVIVDYKFTTVWSCKDGLKPEWEQQMNVYAGICWQQGIQVKGAEIVCIYRDWSKMEARRDAGYPQVGVQVFPVPLWEPEMVVQFIESRIANHRAARTLLPECSAEDRWARPDLWSVKTPGSARAKRLYATEAEAIDACKHGYYIVERRPGEWVRCAAYCSVAPWCEQYQQHLAAL